jgi:hypothetical protein
MISLRLLQVGLCTMGLHLSLEGLRFHLTTETVDDMITEVTSMLAGSPTDLARPVNATGPVDVRNVPELSGDVCDHVVEKAAEQRAWRKHMEPVLTMTNPATTWVSREVANNPIYDYIKAS